MKFRSIFIWCFVLMIIVSCTHGITPISTISPLQSPLPSATVSIVADFVLPTPGLESGVVTGIMKVASMEDAPMSGVEVFLGVPIGSDSDTPFYGLDPSIAPVGTTDEYGRFVITDVPPGDYVVLLWNPVNSIMVRDPDSEEPLVVSVQAQDIVELGVLTESRP